MNKIITMPYTKYLLIAIPSILLGVIIGGMLNKSNAPIDGDHMHDASHEVTVSAEDSGEIWTCSMHPQIRNSEPGICPICEMDLIPLDNTMSNNDPAVLMMSESAVKLAQIETITAGSNNDQGNSSMPISVEGSVMMDERYINAQSSHLTGRVDQIEVTYEGQYIKAGQKIASIYSTELLLASQELLTAAKYEGAVAGIQNASIQKLKNWKLTDQQIEAIIANNKPIETIDIYADHSGYVLDKKVALGDYITMGQTLYTIGRTDKLWLIFNVYESDLEIARIGSPIEFTTPSTGDRRYRATISYIDPLLDEVNRTAIVRAEYNNSGGRLRPGMLLTGQINGRQKQSKSSGVVSIPKSAVLWTGKSSVVYVKVPDTDVPSFEFREVEIGQQNGNSISVTKGLSQGEEIVAKGAFTIDAAAQLNNNMSMMNRDVTVKKEVESDRTPDYTSLSPELFKQQLDDLANSYLDLKNHLVNTDATQAKASVSELLTDLSEIDMTLLEGDAHLYWMDQSEIIKAHASKISATDDVEAQRKQFEHVSDAMIRSVEAFGTSGQTYYVQYCPMANNNQGANWISSQEQIQNPYFGDKMMKCGSIKRLIE